MIISLGFLSLFQLLFLPGLLARYFVKVEGFWENLIFILSLSPILNFFIVALMTAMKIYTHMIVLLLFLVEIIVVFIMYYPALTRRIHIKEVCQSVHQFLQPIFSNKHIESDWKRKLARIYSITLFSIAIGCILVFIIGFRMDLNSVFSTWDAVVSWDKWAVDWSHNQYPLTTYHYPQIIPANWSLTYQFVDEPRIKFFAKFYMGLIEVFILVTLFALGIKKRKVDYFLGVIFTAFFQIKLGSLGSGYVDSAVALWGLFSIFFLLIADDHTNHEKYILIGALISAGGALVKQAGLWIVIMYPLLVYLDKEKSRLSHFSHLLQKIALIDLFVILPWYVYKEIQIRLGIDGSEIHYVTTLGSQGKSIFEIFKSSIDLLSQALSGEHISGMAIIFGVTIFCILSCSDTKIRKIVCFVIFPFTIIWIFFFCYDIRNFNLIVPLLGLSTGVGATNLFKFIFSKILVNENFSRLRSQQKLPIKLHFPNFTLKPYYFLLPSIFLFILPLKYPDKTLITEAIASQRLIGYTNINQRIYEIYENQGFTGKIVTEYSMLSFVPEISPYIVVANQKDDSFMEYFIDPLIEYALVDMNSFSQENEKILNQLIDDNEISVVFIDVPYSLITTCQRDCFGD